MSTGIKAKSRTNGRGLTGATRISPPRYKTPHPTHTQQLVYTPTGKKLISFGFKAAQSVRRSGRFLANSGSGDSHLQDDLDTLRAESQAFDRDNGIYSAMITRVIDCILGDGMILQAKTSSKQTNEKLERLWKEFWYAPDLRGLDDGTAIERLFLRHLFIDGDVGAIKDTRTGLIQMIEAERITSIKTKSRAGNRIQNGVELDKFGRPIAFHIADYNDYGQVRVDPQIVSQHNFVYMANRHRISQTRGFPVQQSNFAMFHRINDVCDSEAIAWQLLSRMAVIINRKDAAGLSEATSEEDALAGGADLAGRYHDFGEAIIFHGEPGEEIKGIDRTIPGANFTDSLKMFLRLLGLPFGFSLEFVLLIWSDTNYSSGRAAIKQVERSCKPWARLLKRSIMEPIYRWKVSRWIDEGHIAERQDIFDHQWHTPPYPFIDPQKEALAQKFRYQTGITSPSREAKEAGYDLNDLVAEQERDLEMIIEAVDRLNLKFPRAGIKVSDFTGFVNESKTPAAPAAASVEAE